MTTIATIDITNCEKHWSSYN